MTPEPSLCKICLMLRANEVFPEPGSPQNSNKHMLDMSVYIKHDLCCMVRNLAVPAQQTTCQKLSNKRCSIKAAFYRNCNRKTKYMAFHWFYSAVVQIFLTNITDAIRNCNKQRARQFFFSQNKHDMCKYSIVLICHTAKKTNAPYETPTAGAACIIRTNEIDVYI